MAIKNKFSLSLMGEGWGESVAQSESFRSEHTLTRFTSFRDLSHEGEVNQSRRRNCL